MSKKNPAKRRPKYKKGDTVPGQAPKPVIREQGIKVRALETGFYDNARRREGDVFVIASADDFSERWMERVDPRTPEHTTSSPEALRREHQKLYGDVSGRTVVGQDNPTGSAGVLGD